MKKFLLELLFPSFCLGCKKEGTYLCQDCKATLEISEYDYCLCNKNPLRLQNPLIGKCGSCKDKKLSGLYSALPYQEKQLTRKLIHQFKYEPFVKDLAKTLAALIAEHLVLAGKNAENIWQNSALVPVPLDTKKMKKRGYNQAQELATELSSIINVPVVKSNLVKLKTTLPQMELSAHQRAENLQGAFAVKNPAEFAGKKVFLVDDVYTTGSTMEGCSNVLRTSGVKQVWGLVIARDN